MEVIIRTQDKERLVRCHNDSGIEEREINDLPMYALLARGVDNQLNWLGEFRSKESVIEELDIIQNAIDFSDKTTPIVEISQS